jgi:hypothetical protein
LFECASACSAKYYCSAFRFDINGNICQLGTKDELQAEDPSFASSIPVHVNPNFVQKGKKKTIFFHCLFITKFIGLYPPFNDASPNIKI